MSTHDSPDERPERVAARTERADATPEWHVTRLPSPRVVASVRFASPPDEPPGSLAAFVARDERDGVLTDWLITEDAIAFGDPSLPLAFTEWRATWEQNWQLETLASLARLREIASGLDGDGPWFRMVDDLLAGVDEHRVAVPQQADLGAECEDLRDLVREREAIGYGVVDASPGRITSGLTCAWSTAGGPEVLARHELLEVRIEPEAGLCLVVNTVDGPELIEGVVSGQVVGDGTVVSSASGERHLDVAQATALGWLLPGIVQWRVRRVPEVLVWAQTFAGLPECCDVATRHGVDVVVRATVRIALISGDERTT